MMRWLPAALVIVLLIVGAISFYAVERHGYHQGAIATKAADAARDNQALREANRALDAMHRKVEAEERRRAQEQAELELFHHQELSDVEAARDRALAAVRRGELRLRNAACAATGEPVRVPAASAGTAGSAPAAEEGGLPGARDEAVVRLLSEADAVVKDANFCWSIVRRDRGMADPIGLEPRRRAGDG